MTMVVSSGGTSVSTTSVGLTLSTLHVAVPPFPPQPAVGSQFGGSQTVGLLWVSVRISAVPPSLRSTSAQEMGPDWVVLPAPKKGTVAL